MATRSTEHALTVTGWIDTQHQDEQSIQLIHFKLRASLLGFVNRMVKLFKLKR